MRSLASLALLAPLVACDRSPATPQEHLTAGLEALAAGESGRAAQELESALAGLPEGDARRDETQLALVRAFAGFEPNRAVDAFATLASETPRDPQDYVRVAQTLQRSDHVVQAAKVNGAGLLAHPTHAALLAQKERLDAALERVKQGLSAEDTSELENLGYLSGGND